MDHAHALIGRRTLLKGALAGLTLSAGGCAASMNGGTPKPYPLAMTDATIRPELAKDYAGTMRRLKAMGYTHFGFRLGSPIPADTSEPKPEEKAAMVRDAGLEVGVVRLIVGGRPVPVEPQLEASQKIGAKVVALTTAPIFIAGKLGVTTRAALDAYIPELDALGAKVRAAGFVFAYHNHWYDLTPLDGDRPLDLIAARTDPRNVCFEVDLAWTYVGGVAPLDLLRKLGRRVVSMHLKDVDRNRATEPTRQCVPPGYGEMNYAALLPEIRKLTHALGAVEVDNAPDGLDAAAKAAAFIRGIWKA